MLLIRLGLLCASTICSLLLAEVGLRMFFPIYLTEEFVREDDELYRTPRENFSGVFRKDYEFRVETNELGFRSASSVGPRDPGVRRVLVIGDSATFGTGVSNGETYPDYLEKWLNHTPPRLDGSPEGFFCAVDEPGSVVVGASWAPSQSPAPELGAIGRIVPDPEVAELSRDLFDTSLQQIRETLAAHGRATGSEPFLAYAMGLGGGPPFELIESRIRQEVATAARVTFIDPRLALRNRPRGRVLGPGEWQADCINRHSDQHWTPTANAIVASYIANQLESVIGPAPKTQVFNAGMWGWSSLQYAIRLRTVIEDIDPDVVLVMFSSNDLRDNLEFISRTSYVSNFMLSPNTNYMWQVQAIYQDDSVSDWSAGAEFRIGSEPFGAVRAADSPGPRPLQPEGMISTLSPEFSWRGVPNAREYRLRLAERNSDGVLSVRLVTRTPGTTFRLPSRIWARTREHLRSLQIVRRVYFTYQAWRLARTEAALGT
jgi:lysophospholipase L1-like esterase